MRKVLTSGNETNGHPVINGFSKATVAGLIVGSLSPMTAVAQSITSDTKPRPGSPITGWSDNFSPTDPYSAGPAQGAWITKAGLIHSRSEVAVGEVNGKMYVLGGYADGNVAQPLNEEYDPADDMWRERAPLPRGGNHIAAVGLDGKLYVGLRPYNG